MFIALAVGFIVLSLIVQILVFGPRQFQKRAKFLLQYTAHKGYRLANPSVAQIKSNASARDLLTDPGLRAYVKGSEGITDIEGLTTGTDDPFAICLRLQGRDAMIFELSVSSRRADDSGNALRYRVAKIEDAGLPRFSLGKHSVADTVLNVVERMTGNPASNIEVASKQFPQFGKHYWLRGPDRSAVLDFLSPGKMGFIENAKLEGVMATNANYFVYYESGGLRTEKDCDAFIKTVDKLAANLL